MTSNAAATAHKLPLPGEVVLVVVMEPAVRMHCVRGRHTPAAPAVRRRHVGCRQGRRERARITAGGWNVAPRGARARGVADALVAHRIFEHAATHDGAHSTTHATLGQESFELPVLLGEFLLVLRDIAIYLLQTEYLVFESFDIKFFSLSMCSAARPNSPRQQSGSQRRYCGGSELTVAPAGSAPVVSSLRACYPAWDLCASAAAHLLTVRHSNSIKKGMRCAQLLHGTYLWSSSYP